MTSQPRLNAARVLRLLLIALLIALMLILLPAPHIFSLAEVVPLPIDESGGVPPYDWGYTDEGAYRDDSISVNIVNGRFEDSDWTAVSIQIKDPSQLRTLKAGRYGSTQEAPGATLSKRVSAVVAFGGDFFAFHNHGYIVRQGQFYRNKANGKFDVLVIDRKGDFHALLRPDKAAVEEFEKLHKDEVVNAFTFGPVLIKDGQPVPDMTQASTDKVLAQRIAICQTGPLSYLVVYCEGPNDENSKGMSIPQFTRLIATFPNVQTAYNLDGGSSATIVFKNEKINGPRKFRSRPIGDIIYFASAFVAPEPTASPEPSPEPVSSPEASQAPLEGRPAPLPDTQPESTP